MNRADSVLAPAFSDLQDALDDFRRAQYQNATSVLSRFAYLFDDEPLSSFLAAVLPVSGFEEWWQKAQQIRGSMVGSGALDWPTDRGKRVALQIELCRALASCEIDLLGFTTNFCYPGIDSRLTKYIREFADTILEPLLRDLIKLSESRVLPPILFEAVGRLPKSGDSTLDALLADACNKFRDPAPSSRKEAVERVWDAWERLKSLSDSNNKRLSVRILLDRASSDAHFRELLDVEAGALTKIGNEFHIRHFETNRSPIVEAEHFEYLFHRMYALLHLLLFTQHAGNE